MKKDYSYKRIRSLIDQYGYLYSAKKFIMMYIAATVFITMVTCIYGINIIFLPFILGTLLVAFPILLNTHYSLLHRLEQFSDVDIYIHQMAYSFKRQPKIIVALEDTKKVVSSKMAAEIDRALKMLEYAQSERVYEEAFKEIEKKYFCSRIITLHKFLVNIEMKGGGYSNSLDILILDFDRWVKQVYKHQIDIKRIRNNSIIGMALSFILASVSVIVNIVLSGSSQVNIDITKEVLYQVASVLFIILCILYFVYIQMKCNRDWLQRDSSPENIQKDYNMAFNTDIKKILLKSVPLYILIGIMCIVFFMLRLQIFAVLGLAVLAIFIMAPAMNKKSAYKRVRRELYYAFSDWLRDVALNLSEEPLQVAIEDTYDNCGYLIKQSLEKFIYSIEDNPSDVRPYYDFLSEYNIADISSTVKTLYSLSNQDAECADSTINVLIERNYSVMGRYEQLKNRDVISVMKFAEYIPTLFVSFKVAVDMILVIINYL